MTSNVGSQYIQEHASDYEKMKSLVMEAMHGHFKPEFLNRVDEFVIFHGLDRDRIREIVDIQLRHLRRRLEGKGITLELSSAAKDLLAGEGYDAAFGARPLKRAIQRLIQDPLARDLIAGKLVAGDALVVDASSGKMAFRRK